MKKTVLLALALIPLSGFSQTFNQLATDITGDDYAGNLDATELSYTLSANQDSLYVKISHATARDGDFGFSLALDTNLNPNDGQSIIQANVVGSPNTSMKYDLLLHGFQNGFFPGLHTQAYGPGGSLITLSFELDTADPYFSIFRIPLTELGGNIDLNLIGCTGSFDIAASGPTDVVPGTTFAEIREGPMGAKEYPYSTKIYPNPASDYFQVDFSGIIKVYNFNGSLVKELKVTSGERIDCSTWELSLYMIISEDGQSIGKLLID